MTNMPNMRTANFRVGFENKTNYNTTTDYNNIHLRESPKASQTDRQNQIQAQKDRVQKNRQPHYDFGSHQNDYQSIAKKDFLQNDLSQTIQASLDRKKNSKDVRQSHF